MAASISKAEQYAERIRTNLIPARIAAEQQLGKVEYERAEYADLAGRLKKLEQRGGGAESTMMEFGAGVWVDAVMPDTRRIIIDLGFDLHLDLPLKEAREYADARVKMLEKRCVVMDQRRGQIQWQIEQFEGAIMEVRS